MKLLDQARNNNMMKLVLKGVTLLYVSLVVLFIIKVEFNIVKLGLLTVSTMIHLYRHTLKDTTVKVTTGIILLAVFEFTIMIFAFYNTGTEIENTVFVLYCADIIIRYNLWFSIPMIYLGYIVYLYLWTPKGYDFVFYFISIINQTIMYIPMWAAKVLLSQQNTILKLNDKLLEQSTAMENLATLKERNRIAEEVHDTVGHTLTTAIVALEGANLLFESRPEEAHEKILIAKRQLKLGLGDIRTVVKKLNNTDSDLHDVLFEDVLNEIIYDVKSQTDIDIVLSYKLTSDLVSLQEHVIKNVIKEGITNAIKHGHADQIHISLISEEDVVCLTIKDNGSKLEDVQMGFGLTSMTSRLESLGGNLSYNKEKNGFKLMVMLPEVQKEE